MKVYLPDDNEIARQRQQQMLEEDEKLAQQLGGGRDVAGLETGVLLPTKLQFECGKSLLMETLLSYRTVYNGCAANRRGSRQDEENSEIWARNGNRGISVEFDIMTLELCLWRTRSVAFAPGFRCPPVCAVEQLVVVSSGSQV